MPPKPNFPVFFGLFLPIFWGQGKTNSFFHLTFSYFRLEARRLLSCRRAGSQLKEDCRARWILQEDLAKRHDVIHLNGFVSGDVKETLCWRPITQNVCAPHKLENSTKVSSRETQLSGTQFHKITTRYECWEVLCPPPVYLIGNSRFCGAHLKWWAILSQICNSSPVIEKKHPKFTAGGCKSCCCVSYYFLIFAFCLP